jgi:AraC-like DNA-binding protein
MLAQEYLTLRLVRLKPSEKWIHTANGLAFVFLKDGCGKYASPEVTHHLAAGDALVLSGTQKGESGLYADEGREMVFWFFAANIEHLFPLFAIDEVCLLQGVAESLKGTRLYVASSPLAGECRRLLADVPPRFGLDHRGQLLRVAAAILSEEFKAAQPNQVGFVRAEKHLVQVFETLSASDLLSLSVGELAGRFSCSKRHLNRLFHQHFGFSVAALRMEMRLLKAASLLRDPDTKVINVAEECGFNHLGLFNTCFKRRFGASPGQWRKTSAQAESQPVQPVNNPVPCPLQPSGLCPLTGNSDVRKPAAGEAIETRKTALARVVFGKQIPDAGAGLDLVAGQRKVAGTASRQNLVQPRP